MTFYDTLVINKKAKGFEASTIRDCEIEGKGPFRARARVRARARILKKIGPIEIRNTIGSMFPKIRARARTRARARKGLLPQFHNLFRAKLSRPLRPFPAKL